MIFRSGDNLNKATSEFIKVCESVTLFSAYIKLQEIKNLNTKKNIQQIVVRWEVQDLCLRVSDLELYEYCKKHKITLYRNTRIHLKAIWNNHDSVFFGSANITGKGIGEKGTFNYELNGMNTGLSLEDKLYFKDIISSSELVDEKLYLKLKSLKEAYESKKIDYPRVPTEPQTKDMFLLSQLPMSLSPEFMIKSFFNRDSLSIKDEECLINDLSTYRIDISLDKEDMEVQLKERFNNHPIIIALKKNIITRDRRSLKYGDVVRWIQKNTSTVPTPRSREMKKNKIVNILYDWLCYFDDRYYWYRPNHSDVIFFDEDLNILKIIDESRDEARGHRAPHQIVLLAALKNIYDKTNSKLMSIKDLNDEFQNIWIANQIKYNSTNANIGMPIEALFNKHLLGVNSIKKIDDFRNINKPENAVTSLELRPGLVKLFNQVKESDYILSYL